MLTGKRFWTIAALLLATLSGCVFPKEADKVLADQSKKGGQKVQEDGKKVEGVGISLQGSADPEVAEKGKELEATGKDLQETGKELELNSGQLQEVIGMPEKENQKPFSPQVSGAARTESAEKHANPWWKVAGSWVIGIVFGGAGIAALQRFFPGFFAGPLGVAASALMEGIARVRKMAAAKEDGKIGMDEVLAELKRIQENQGVQTVVRDMAHKVEKKIFGEELKEPVPTTGAKPETGARPE